MSMVKQGSDFEDKKDVPYLTVRQAMGVYRQFCNISHIQSPNINVSRPVLQLSLPNALKPGVKLRMKM